MKNQFSFGRFVILAGLFVATLLVIPPTARSGLLPGSGKFYGYYHKNCFGLCTFGYSYDGSLHFLVDPQLDAQLSKYEGKLINLEAKKIEQPLNPGAGIITEIGDVVVREPFPLEIKVNTLGAIAPDTPFLLNFTYENKNKKQLDVGGIFFLSTSSLTEATANLKDKWANDVDNRYKYTGKVLVTESEVRPIYPALTVITEKQQCLPPLAERYLAVNGMTYKLLPVGGMGSGACFFRDGLPAGKYEFSVNFQHYDGVAGTWLPVAQSNFAIVEVSANAKIEKQKNTCTMRAEIASAKDMETVLRVTIKNESKKDISLRMLKTDKAELIAGVIQARNKEGRDIPLTVLGTKTAYDRDAWEDRTLKTGEDVQCEYHVAASDPFRPTPIAKYIVTILPEGEMDVSEVAVEKDLTWLPPPDFGAPLDKTRLRVRTSQDEYNVGDDVDIFYQVYAAGWNFCRGGTREDRDSHRVFANIYVDDKEVMPITLGPDLSSAYKMGSVTIAAASATAKPGEHTVKIVYSNPEGGSFKGEGGKEQFYLKGEMSSNVFKYTVKEKKNP